MGSRGGKAIVFELILSFIPTLIVLGVLIFIHEMGHFVSAKLSGIAVEKFSVGFGPEIFKFTRNKTEYAFSAIPFGGFVKMSGETFDEREGGKLRSDDFLAQNVFKRFIVLFSGSFMNYVLGFVLLVIVFVAGAPTIGTKIGDILKDSPAYTSGLHEDDKVLAINGQSIGTWNEMTGIIQDSGGKPMQFKVLREEQELVIPITAKKFERKDIFGDTHTLYQIGVASGDEFYYTKYSFFPAIKEAARALYDLTAMTYKSIFRLVTGRLSLKVMSGPLGIFDMASKTAKKGIIPLLQLTAYITVFLAVFNLLPFPALDGGHLFFLLVEAVFRKPVSFHLQERFAQIGFVLLMCLMLFVMYNDIERFGWIDKLRQIFF